MRIKKIKQIGIGFMSVVLLGGLAGAEANTRLADSLAMPLTREGGTARAMSMGSAVVSVPQGSASLFWNPAGLGKLGSCMEVGLHHNSGLGESVHETAVFGLPMGSLGNFAASLNYVNNGTFEGRDEVGLETGDYRAGDFGGSLGWGKQWFTGISAGAAIKYNRQTLDSTSYSAAAMDLGLLWNPLSRLDLGLTYSNIGTKVAGGFLDSGWRVGSSYGVTKNLLLAASSELKSGGFERLQIGAEDYVHPSVALRAGYVHSFKDFNLTGLTGLTAGLGVMVKKIMMDYAYVPHGELGSSHRISLTYKFACKPCKEKPVPAAVTEPVAEVEPPVVVVLDKLIILEDKHFTFSDDTHFEFGTSILTREGALAVIDNTKILKDNPEAKIRIAGYASAAGTEEYNQKLSERRAKAIESILVNVGGVDPARITTIGYGETRPAMYEPLPKDIDSKEARANMRVLFEVIVK